MSGRGVFDFIIKDQYDQETGHTYKALTCVNDPDMAARCKVSDAKRALWSVKANAEFNSQICVTLRNDIRNGRINFLIHELESDEFLAQTFKGYAKLPGAEKALLKRAYAETTLAEYELIKLKHEVVNNKVRVREVSGMRKDRYSSLAYNDWCVKQLEQRLRPSAQTTEDLISQLIIRPVKPVGMFA